MKKLKAVFKDDAVRCEKCDVEIWEGVDCDCGVDGVDHDGLTEAYEEKKKIDAETFRKLNNDRMKAYRDKNRARKYSPRPSRLRVK
ncbi:hypothetical protein MUO79_01060 [Candidatus Bathyarchaeota archaeon]|nr:hypothetical protein [Candidatus Bathyarchaeota archaeon]